MNKVPDTSLEQAISRIAAQDQQRTNQLLQVVVWAKEHNRVSLDWLVNADRTIQAPLFVNDKSSIGAHQEEPIMIVVRYRDSTKQWEVRASRYDKDGSNELVDYFTMVMGDNHIIAALQRAEQRVCQS